MPYNIFSGIECYMRLSDIICLSEDFTFGFGDDHVVCASNIFAQKLWAFHFGFATH